MPGQVPVLGPEQALGEPAPRAADRAGPVEHGPAPGDEPVVRVLAGHREHAAHGGDPGMHVPVAVAAIARPECAVGVERRRMIDHEPCELSRERESPIVAGEPGGRRRAARSERRRRSAGGRPRSRMARSPRGIRRRPGSPRRGRTPSRPGRPRCRGGRSRSPSTRRRARASPVSASQVTSPYSALLWSNMFAPRATHGKPGGPPAQAVAAVEHALERRGQPLDAPVALGRSARHPPAQQGRVEVPARGVAEVPLAVLGERAVRTEPCVEPRHVAEPGVQEAHVVVEGESRTVHEIDHETSAFPRLSPPGQLIVTSAPWPRPWNTASAPLPEQP